MIFVSEYKVYLALQAEPQIIKYIGVQSEALLAHLQSFALNSNILQNLCFSTYPNTFPDLSIYSFSSTNSIQCFTATSARVAKCIWQPIFAVTITSGESFCSECSLLVSSCCDSSGWRME